MTIVFGVVAFFSNGQTVVVNEISQGTGAAEYVELLVVGEISCGNLPCMDLRGLIIDDNNGNFATGSGTGIAQGAARFSNDDFWSCIPIGTLIVIYNDADPNSSLADTDDMDIGDCSLTVPISSSLFEHHPSLPNNTDANYPTTGWVPGGSWASVSMSNANDSFQILDPSNTTDPIFAVSWGNNATSPNTNVGFSGSASNTVYSFNNTVDNDFSNINNWIIGTVPTEETPGIANGIENSDYISTMSNNCTAPLPLAVSYETSNTTCFGECNGEIVILPTNGTGNYIFSVTDLNLNLISNNDTVPNLCDGSYIITSTDQSGCEEIDTLIITSPNDLLVSETHTDEQCFESCDGTIDVSVSGGTGMYIYNWSNGSTTNSIANLCEGMYNLTIEDENNCTATISVNINTAVPLNISTSGTNASCGNCDGTATANYSGGTGALTVVWSNNSNQDNISNLCAGNYEVTVTDENGCTLSTNQIISNLDGPTVTIDSFDNPLCFDDCNGSISISSTGGFGQLSYVWDNGSTSEDLNNLCAGSYCVTVTDENDCATSVCQTLTAPEEIETAINTSDVSCFGFCDGQASIQIISGGTPPFSYDWFNQGDTPNSSNNTGLCEGDYTVSVNDNNGCTSNISLSILEPEAISLNTEAYPVSCYGNDDGEGIVIPSGGTVNNTYEYQWLDGLGNTIGTSTSIANLPPGTYLVTVTDDNGCIAYESIPISEPPSLNLNATLTNANCSADDGEICVEITGGNTEPISYAWYNDANALIGTSDCLSSINAGVYTILVNQNDCELDSTFNLIENNGPIVRVDSITNPLCFDSCDGLIYVSSTDSNLTYTYQFNGGITQNTNLPLINLCSGDYTIYAEDSNGCTGLTSTSLTNPTLINIEMSNDTSICIGGCATLSASASGGTGSYVFDWGINNTNSQLLDCPESNTSYIVNVIDDNGCNISDSINVTIYDSLFIELSSNLDTVCIGDSITINIQYSGGIGFPYSTEWTPTPDGIIDSITTYYYVDEIMDVSVNLSDACETPSVSSSVTLNYFEYPDLEINPENISGCAPLTTNFNTNLSSNYNYLWYVDDEPLSENGSSISLTFSDPGEYAISLEAITDENCILNSLTTANIEVYPNTQAIIAENDGQTLNTLENNFLLDGDKSTNADFFEWYINDQWISDLSQVNYAFENEGEYEVSLVTVSEDGCSDTTYILLEVLPHFQIYVPNAFSPNQDGLNDVFIPQGIDINENDFDFYIYNRWGELIFFSNTLTYWDGKSQLLNNEAVQEDVYVWYIRTIDEKGQQIEKVGHVTLLR